MREIIALAIMRFLEMEIMADFYLEEADAIIAAIKAAPKELRKELQ
jgi:hypothetical protein